MADWLLAQPGSGPRESMAGTTLGPYRIERQIGRGGMAAVYEARHLALGRTVALKVLLAAHADEPVMVERFLAEARAAARLDHPHIVPIYDCGEVEGVNFIAMKLLEGRDLKRALQEERQEGRGRLPLERAVGLLRQAAGALDYAHEHGVVHRDVKPANIYVDANDGVTLVDFGIAWALDLSAATMTGMVIGTPLYMAPEQALGKRADHRSDIYSLGVVLYEMLAGALPFSGEQQTVMYAHVHTPPPPLQQARPDLPQAVVEAVDRALAKNPDDRFQSAGALAAALTSACGIGEDRTQIAVARSVHEDDTAWGPVLAGERSMLAPPSAGTPAENAAAGVQAARERRRLVWLAVAGGLIVVAAIVIWALVATPLLGGTGRLTVETDPAGATVSVDGNVVGTTPLAAQTLSAGTHQVVLAEPTYLQVTRHERIERGGNDTIKSTLPPAPAFDLLDVKAATVATGLSQDATGRILAGSEIDSVAAGDPFALILSVAQKQPGYRDISFHCQVELFGPTGTRVAGSDPVTITIPKDDAGEHSCAGRVELPSSAAGGTYTAKYFIDGKGAAPDRPIAFAK